MENNAAQNPVRVCFVMPKIYPLFNSAVNAVFGGAEVDFYNLATELAGDMNFSVSCIVADYGQPDKEVRENVTLIKSLDFNKNLFSKSISILHALRRADVSIYLQETASWGTFLVAFFCKLHKRAFIYRTATAGECDGSWPRNFFEQKFFILALRWADFVITQNVADAEKLRSTTGIQAVVIPNGHKLLSPSQSIRDTILWVGRSDKIKRPELFIDLAEKMHGEKFMMICQRATGDNEYDKLIAQAKRLKNLEFIDRVPFAQIDSYFQRARVFVNTSDFEGFPNTFIQACKSSVPILSLNVNPDCFLDKYKCGQSCNGDFTKLISTLQYILGENRYLELGKNARSYAETRHDIKKITIEYKNRFKKLLEKKDIYKCAE
jgi:glycosyltransferase involved in cell wall biosynthesis